MSTRERSNSCRRSSAAVAASIAALCGGAPSAGAISPLAPLLDRARLLEPRERDREPRLAQPGRGLQRGRLDGRVADRVQHRRDLGEVDLAAGEEAAQPDVLRAVEQGRRRGLPVAAGAPDLLVVAVERLRDLRVHDPADVRLVDAHPERRRRHDHVEVVVHEARLGGLAVAPAHPGVVGGRAQAVLAPARRPAPRRRAAWRRRRSPAARRPPRARAAPAACGPRARGARRRAGSPGGRTRASARAGRAARAARRSRRGPAARPSRSARSPSAARAPRPPRRAAGSRAGSRAPTRRCSAPRRPPSATARRSPARRARPGGASCSGARKTNSSASSASSASASARSDRPTAELIAAAPPAACARSSSTWSRWSASSGETTTVAPGSSRPGDLVDRRLARPGRHDDERVAARQRRLDRLALPWAQRVEAERLARDALDPVGRHRADSARFARRRETAARLPGA